MLNFFFIFPDFAQLAVDLTYSYNMAAETVADYVYQAWVWRDILQSNIDNHNTSILIQNLSTITATEKSVIISHLRASIDAGDNILMEAGWDLVAGHLRPLRSDIVHHVGLLRDR